MARRKPVRSRTTARLSTPPVTLRWPHLQDLIDSGGTLSIGAFDTELCAAIASDEHNMLAALARREGESLSDMLQRLDAAVAKAVEHEHITDEINPPPSTRR